MVYVYEDSVIKSTKHFEKWEKRGRGNRNILEGMNLFKVNCKYV
jgi:hypothetical protein